MGAMPRPRPPHLLRERTRWGRVCWYVRFGKGSRVRIRADYGTPEFEIEYQAALAGQPRPKSSTKTGSLAWLIERYRETPAWQHFSLATRRQRENIFKQVIATAGDEPFGAITEASIAQGRDRRGNTPFQARHFLDTMRGLFRWAEEAQHVKINPAAKVHYPALKSGDGFPPWTEDDVAAYEAQWPLGTRQRVWLAVLLYTGLRRGDAVGSGVSMCAMAWQPCVLKRPVSKSTSRSCGRSSRRLKLVRPAILHSSAAPTENRSPRNHSEMSLPMHAVLPASASRHTGCERLEPPAWPTTARPWHN